jgi:hypothetical protein
MALSDARAVLVADDIVFGKAEAKCVCPCCIPSTQCRTVTHESRDLVCSGWYKSRNTSGLAISHHLPRAVTASSRQGPQTQKGELLKRTAGRGLESERRKGGYLFVPVLRCTAGQSLPGWRDQVWLHKADTGCLSSRHEGVGGPDWFPGDASVADETTTAAAGCK